MVQNIKKIIKRIIPATIIENMRRRKENRMIKSIHQKQDKAIAEIRGKRKITVAFFIIHDSVWKLDDVFKSMLEDERYQPVIVICPYTSYGEDIMQQHLQQSYNHFKDKGYEVINTYDAKNDEWIDIKTTLNPDIIFFTNPHEITRSEYYITNFLDKLTCYVPYNYGASHLLELFHNQLFHNLLWKLFAETEVHKKFSVDYAQNKGKNVIVTGFPGTDIFLDKSYTPTNPWKKTNFQTKKIIWAPHHTIEEDTSVLGFSSFLSYADFMFEIAEKYKTKIQLAFKPHPILKSKLYSHPEWGKERTDLYYKRWELMENGQLEEGDYIDLFISSDAMIHDSGSFLIEYLYLNKPVLRTDRDDTIIERLNPFGIMAYDVHYHARTEEDIIHFINNVMANKDEMANEREAFRQKHLLPPHGKSASQNIMDEINKYFKY